jgi:hypothetical protein
MANSFSMIAVVYFLQKDFRKSIDYSSLLDTMESMLLWSKGQMAADTGWVFTSSGIWRKRSAAPYGLTRQKNGY